MIPPLIDLHEDISLYYVSGGAAQRFPYADLAKDVKGRHGDIPKFRRANLKLIFSAIAPLTYTISAARVEQLTKGYGVPVRASRPRSPTLLALQHILTYYDLAKRHSDDLKLVYSGADLRKFGRDKATRFLLAIEGAEPIEDVEDLHIFYRLGVRSLQLTWNFDNRYAASCMSKKDYGLTGDGESLVSLCNDLGVILDLSHASKNTVMETVSLSKLPLVVSHANAKGVHNHVRNLDDEELQAIKERRGVVGVDLISPTISVRASIKSLADHVMYVHDSFGVDILAVGTDFFGLGDTVEPEGIEDITKIGSLWKELLRRGLNRRKIEQISYKNALRVIVANAAKWNGGQ